MASTRALRGPFRKPLTPHLSVPHQEEGVGIIPTGAHEPQEPGSQTGPPPSPQHRQSHGRHTHAVPVTDSSVSEMPSSINKVTFLITLPAKREAFKHVAGIKTHRALKKGRPKLSCVSSQRKNTHPPAKLGLAPSTPPREAPLHAEGAAPTATSPALRASAAAPCWAVPSSGPETLA